MQYLEKQTDPEELNEDKPEEHIKLLEIARGLLQIESN